jgi:hypothetical protein
MYKIEDKLKELMLKNVEMRVDNKILRKGKIKVFNTKQFFIKFKLETEHSGIKDYEIPYPYRVQRLENGFLFDYCLSAFIPNTEEVFWKMKTVSREKNSKIHEKYLYIIPLSSLSS